MQHEDKKADKKSQSFDGVVRVHETTNLKHYRERVTELEARLITLEERIDEIEHILLLGRS